MDKFEIDLKVANYHHNYQNEVNELLDNFKKEYQKMQKELLEYRKEKEGDVYELNFISLFNLKFNINRKIQNISNEIRGIIRNKMKIEKSEEDSSFEELKINTKVSNYFNNYLYTKVLILLKKNTMKCKKNYLIIERKKKVMFMY